MTIKTCDIQASFEKAYWRIEPLLEENDKELASSTLRSIVLNYIQRSSPNPPKALVKALNGLKKRDDIVITGLMPHLYRRYVDDTLVRMPNTDAATMVLTTLNGLHPSLSFTMELPVDDRIPFIGIDIIKNGTKLETQVYRKPTNTGLLLHFHSHTDKRYKDSLLKTMLHRAYALSSTTEAFNEECAKLRSIFSRLDYP